MFPKQFFNGHATCRIEFSHIKDGLAGKKNKAYSTHRTVQSVDSNSDFLENMVASLPSFLRIMRVGLCMYCTVSNPILEKI